MDDCNLIDMGFNGNSFTWCNRWPNGRMVFERLDRVFCNSAWFSLFPNSKIDNLGYRTSDHRPVQSLVARAPAGQITRTNWILRFEEVWMEDSSCEEVVGDDWSRAQCDGNSSALKAKLNSCLRSLSKWGSNRTGNYKRRIRGAEVKVK